MLCLLFLALKEASAQNIPLMQTNLENELEFPYWQPKSK
jgi:hypothetical protein